MPTSNRNRPLRIVILPIEVAGYGAGLQDGLEALGHQADLLLLNEHPFKYPTAPPRSPLLRALVHVVRRRAAGGRPGRLLALAEQLLRLAAAVEVAVRYDAVVYMWGMSLLHGYDLLLARVLGTTTIVVYLGSDARPPYLNGILIAPDGEHSSDLGSLARLTASKARLVRRMEHFAHYAINHPPTAQFHRRRYLDFLSIGVPSNTPLPEVLAVDDPDHQRLRVLHAPSQHVHKGSDRIRAAVAELAAEGVPVELVELHGVPNVRVHEALATCDLVIDELYSDTVLAGLGTEAAHHGKPVLVFGNASELLTRLCRRAGVPIAQYAPPEELRPRLAHFLGDAEARRELGATLASFVRTEWHPAAVARRFERLVRRDPDPTWWNQPGAFPYEKGFGLPWEVLEGLLAEYVATQGEDALELSPSDATRRRIHAHLTQRHA